MQAGKGRVLWTGAPRFWRIHPLKVPPLLLSLALGISLLTDSLLAEKQPPPLAVVLIAVPAAALTWWIVAAWGTRLTITENLITLQSGVWIRRIHRLRPADVTRVSVQQNPLQRLLGVGGVRVVSPALVGTLAMDGIADPQNVAELIHELREAAGRL